MGKSAFYTPCGLLILVVLHSVSPAATLTDDAEASEGRCAVASRCCSGRDSSCVVQPAEARGFKSRPCYCDEGCLETGDCCPDYKAVCNVKVIDCEVSSWSEWSACNNDCGKGLQRRSRLVVHHPSVSGRSCPITAQKRNCDGFRCSSKYNKYENPIRETAGLLPARYLEFQQNDGWDVRDNLFKHSILNKKKSYSGEENRQDFENAAMASNIEDGFQAEQPSTEPEEEIRDNENYPSCEMIHMILNEIARLKMVSAKAAQSSDLVNYKSADQSIGNRRNGKGYCIVFQLAYVAKACDLFKDFEKMAPGDKMCALCQKGAKQETLGGRCKGHGVDSRLTRWRSSVNPKCHGKWRRIHEVGTCPCKEGPDFIFV